jgi:hypothetical protein
LDRNIPANAVFSRLTAAGIRDWSALGILKPIEGDLAKSTNRGSNFRLSDYFDFIGGCVPIN